LVYLSDLLALLNKLFDIRFPRTNPYTFTEKPKKIVNDHNKMLSIHGESKKTVNLQPIMLEL